MSDESRLREQYKRMVAAFNRPRHGDGTMTVAELIAQLQQLPSDTRVLVSGYEGGLDDPASLELVPDIVTLVDRSYYGSYDRPASPIDDVAEVPRFPAVIIPRPGR